MGRKAGFFCIFPGCKGPAGATSGRAMTDSGNRLRTAAPYLREFLRWLRRCRWTGSFSVSGAASSYSGAWFI